MAELVNVVLKEYWSKADAFLLPLTGIKKNLGFEVNSYLFWKDHSIEDYKLVVAVSYDDQDLFLEYVRTTLLPQMDKRGLVMESYDLPNRSVFVVDLSEWAMDVEAFLMGKYSFFSKKLKTLIEQYHAPGNKSDMEPHILCSLYPTREYSTLGNLNALEYVSKNWGFNFEDLSTLGEIGGIYDRKAETLMTDVEDIWQFDRKVAEA